MGQVGKGDGCIHLLSNMAATRHTSLTLSRSLPRRVFSFINTRFGLCEVRRQAAGGVWWAVRVIVNGKSEQSEE